MSKKKGGSKDKPRNQARRVDQGVSPSRSTRQEARPQTIRQAVKQSEAPRLENLFRAHAGPDYQARVARYVVDARPTINPIHKGEAFKPSPVIQTPKAKPRPNAQSFKKKEHDNSLSVRDKISQCKTRPDKLEPRRAGGGAAKKFVPWCK